MATKVMIFLIMLSVTAEAQISVPRNDVPIGIIQPFAQSTCPSGWLPADGSAVSRTTYSKLFAAIGTTYGAGNGTTTFNLPSNRCTSEANCTMTFVARIPTDKIPVGENVDWISGNCTGSSTTTCTVIAGIFTVTPVCEAHATAFAGDSQHCNGRADSATSLISVCARPDIAVTNSDHSFRCTKTGADFKANPIRNACVKF